MLPLVDILPVLPAALDSGCHLLHARLEFWLVVERGHDHMPSLMPLRVVAVVAHDEPLDAVILGINLCHGPTVSPCASRITRGVPDSAVRTLDLNKSITVAKS